MERHIVFAEWRDILYNLAWKVTRAAQIDCYEKNVALNQWNSLVLDQRTVVVSNPGKLQWGIACGRAGMRDNRLFKPR